MSGWGFDWVSGLVGFVIGAVAIGFLSKAGESLHKKIAERFSPAPPEPKAPIRIRADFSDAPDNIKEQRLKYNRERYRQTWMHPSDRSPREAEGWFAPTTHEGEEVSAEDGGQIKLWFVKAPWVIKEPEKL